MISTLKAWLSAHAQDLLISALIVTLMLFAWVGGRLAAHLRRDGL